MKILNIAAAVALSIVSVSAGAKGVDQIGIADNVFAYTTSATGSQPVVIGSAIEGDFSSQMAVAVGAAGHAISGGGGHAISGGGGHAISGGGGHAISGGGGHAISGGGGHAISGGGGHAISGGGGK
jgi:hypothetical protein